MTNINCSKDCVYQQDGKCCYDNVLLQTARFQNEGGAGCAYQLTAEQAKTLDFSPKQLL